jgi:ATP-dependent Lon protease
MTEEKKSKSSDSQVVDHKMVLPLLPLRDIVIFPESFTPLFVGRPRSVSALETAIKTTAEGGERKIVLSVQKAARTEDPGPDDVHSICTIGTVKTLVLLQNKMMKVLVAGVERARILRFVDPSDSPLTIPEELEVPPYLVEVERLKPSEQQPSEEDIEELTNQLQKAFEDYARLSKRVQVEVPRNVSEIREPGSRADVIAGYMPLKPNHKQNLLEELDIAERLRSLTEMVENECEVVRMQRKVRGRFKTPSEARSVVGKPPEQHDQGDDLQDEFKNELNDLEKRLAKTPLTDEARDRVARELKKLRMMSMMSAEATVVRSYLDWIATLPWQHYTKDRVDIAHAEAILNEDHYGLEKVKERILEHLAVQKLVDRPKGPILCLVGPPGVGKTSLAKSIARSTGREFVRLSLGGVRDEAEIRGHRRTYIGALPGKIISSFKRAGASNPVLLLDEIDKMSTDFRGDPAAALLEVLDPEQNHAFADHYLDLDYDLSKVLFLCTANSLAGISEPLQDRLEIIRLSGYTDLEKMAIAKRYLVPKQLESNGLAFYEPIGVEGPQGERVHKSGAKVHFSDGALKKLLNNYTRESGVRNLERQIGTCSRKGAIELLKKIGDLPENLLSAKRDESGKSIQTATADNKEAEPETVEIPVSTDAPAADGDAPAPASDDSTSENQTAAALEEEGDPSKAALRQELNGKSLRITAKKVREYLGVENFRRRDTDEMDQVGVTNGLAWTSSGGEILLTEVVITPGKGKLQVTGKLGDVMQESARAAMTYVRSRALSLGLPQDFYDRIDVHIHVPEGATPKDGPSAGITIATSLVSALTRIPVRHDVAMTGELTLRGQVTAIGGLKEKSLAAYRSACKTVIIPQENEKDLADIHSVVKKNIHFRPVSSVDEVMKIALALEDPDAFFERLANNEKADVFDESLLKRGQSISSETGASDGVH